MERNFIYDPPGAVEKCMYCIGIDSKTDQFACPGTQSSRHASDLHIVE